MHTYDINNQSRDSEGGVPESAQGSGEETPLEVEVRKEAWRMVAEKLGQGR